MFARMFVMTAFTLVLLGGEPAKSVAQDTVRLFAPDNTPRRATVCLNFQTGLSTSSAKCDLLYGLLGINEDFDWLQSQPSSRSVMRDLGTYSWETMPRVPVVPSLPKLQPGEQRRISIDVSGADGADGAPGAPGLNADGTRNPPPPLASPSKPKHDGVPKIDPMFLKAVVGHMYVAHVVTEVSDFYALFRVDDLAERSCAISWKVVPSPKE